MENIYIPVVLRPGVAVNRATSTIFTANGWPDSRWMQRRTIENGPLKRERKNIRVNVHIADDWYLNFLTTICKSPLSLSLRF